MQPSTAGIYRRFLSLSYSLSQSVCSVICEIIKGAILYRLICRPKIKRGRKRAALFFQRARRASVLYQRPLLYARSYIQRECCWAASHTCATPPPAKKARMDRPTSHIIVFHSLIHRSGRMQKITETSRTQFALKEAGGIVNGAFVTRRTWCQSVWFGAKKNEARSKRVQFCNGKSWGRSIVAKRIARKKLFRPPPLCEPPSVLGTQNMHEGIQFFSKANIIKLIKSNFQSNDGTFKQWNVWH